MMTVQPEAFSLALRGGTRCQAAGRMQVSGQEAQTVRDPLSSAARRVSGAQYVGVLHRRERHSDGYAVRKPRERLGMEIPNSGAARYREELVFAVQQRVHAPVVRVWAVIGDFGTEHRWTSTLVHCTRDTPLVRVGTSRICTLARPLMGHTRVREELTEFCPEQALTYRLDGPAGPFHTAASRWVTRADADGSTMLTVEGRFTPQNTLVRVLLWPVVRPMLARLTRKVIGELDTFLQVQEKGLAPG